MKKWLIILGSVLLTVLIGLAGAYAWLTSYISSDELIEDIRKATSDTLGAKVQFSSLDVSLVQGFIAENLIVNPPEDAAEKPFLYIQTVDVDHSLYSLFSKELKVTYVDIYRPQVTLRKLPDGASNIPKFPEEATQVSLRTSLLHFPVVLDEFKLREGSIIAKNPQGEVTLRVVDGFLEGTLASTGRGIEATGSLEMKQLALSQQIYIENISSPFTLRNNELTLSNALGEFSGGVSRGTMNFNFGVGEPSFTFKLSAIRIPMEKLLENYSSQQGLMGGTMDIELHAEGSMLEPSLVQGTGTLVIHQADLSKLEAFRTLSQMLNLPPKAATLGKISGQYKIENEKITFYQLEGKSSKLEFTAGGSFSFDRSLDFDILIGLHPSIEIPEPYREQLSKREDGFRMLTFHLGGTLSKPASNLRRKLEQPPAPQEPPRAEPIEQPSEPSEEVIILEESIEGNGNE